MEQELEEEYLIEVLNRFLYDLPREKRMIFLRRYCWNEEEEWIEKSLKFGALKKSDWKYGKIIEGIITAEFITMILDMPKPEDVEIYNKMTPFFSIFLDEYNFQSCHYGTEIYVKEIG